MQKIFLVEDDLSIAESMVTHLCSWGYHAVAAVDFQNVLEEFKKFDPQLVLMDIALPFFNGYHWCSEIRKISGVPIIFVSSAGDNMNIIMAVNMGGDDFVAKPFDLGVLTAKIQAILRRAYSFSGKCNIIEHRELTLKLDDFTLLYKDKKAELTKNEFKILELLLHNTGKIISRETMMTILWENDTFVDDNTLTVNITRIRKKLEELGLQNFIVTKKRVGYMIEA
ncbi:MAG: response regulator transcription factor [Oscillospiraceae bacterium]